MTRVREWGLQDRPLNTVHFESPSHTTTLLCGLNTLRTKGLLLDVTLVADGEAFQVCVCHEMISCLFIVKILNASQVIVFGILFGA